MMIRENTLIAVPLEPAAVTVIVDPLLVAVGVPESRPVALSVRPAGTPVADHTQFKHPGAERLWLYGVPTVPLGSEPFVVMAKGCTVRVYVLVRLRVVAVSRNPRTTFVNAPDTVGVPDRSPVFVLIVIPGGKPVAENVYDPLPPPGMS
jgi:hypothetical protein